MKKIFQLILLSSFLTFSINSIAQTTNANFQVSSTLTPTCEVSVLPIDFGNMQPAATGFISRIHGISMKCSKDVGYEIKFSSLSGGNGAFNMSGLDPSNTDKLEYMVWIFPGDGQNYYSTYISTGTGVTQNIGMRARLNRNQYIKPDVYSDEINVTITY